MERKKDRIAKRSSGPPAHTIVSCASHGRLPQQVFHPCGRLAADPQDTGFMAVLTNPYARWTLSEPYWPWLGLFKAPNSRQPNEVRALLLEAS